MSSVHFQGTAWLLLEPRTTFYSPRYSQDSFTVRSQVLPFWKQPQIVLQLGQTDYLVLNSGPADAAKRSGDPKEAKKLLQLTARPLDDVRRAQLYQTAVRTQVLEVFVDAEHTRERLLRCLRGDESVDPGKKMLDEAFEALERAQQCRDKETAIKLYKEAERGFWEAEKMLTDNRSIEFLRARRADLQRTIRGLENQMKRAGDITQTPPAPVATLSTDEVTAPPSMDISARLEELRRFAAQQEDCKLQAQQENRTDLTSRLAALKNEKAGPAPPLDALTERLRKLKGSSGSTEAVSVVGGGSLNGKCAVDRIIEQVADEIALGIEDEEIESGDVEESDSDGKSRSSSSSSYDTDSLSDIKKRNDVAIEWARMEHAVRLDGERLLGVLESTVRNLELLATLPDPVPTSDDFQPAVREALHRQSVIEAGLLHFIEQQNKNEKRPETEEDGDFGATEEELQHHTSQLPGPVATRLFPKTLHQLLRGLKEDRSARDMLRKLSATSVSPAISRLTEAWMQLIINTDAALSTSFEQDERFALNLRDSMLRLREAEDDRDQVAFELAQARESRIAMSDKFAAQRARLEAQLRDTKRAADDVLGLTARDREEHLQGALSSFETQNASSQKQVETIQRTIARVTQASQQVETDERKHTQHAATELRELIRRYDDDMEKLDTEIEEERAEATRLDAANDKFAMHFARIDKDRRNMIEEQRAIDLAEKLRRNREANLFGFVLRMQAVVRGFITRKRLRLKAQRKNNRSRKGKKWAKGKKRVNKSPTRKKAVKKSSVKARTKKT